MSLVENGHREPFLSTASRLVDRRKSDPGFRQIRPLAARGMGAESMITRHDFRDLNSERSALRARLLSEVPFKFNQVSDGRLHDLVQASTACSAVPA